MGYKMHEEGKKVYRKKNVPTKKGPSSRIKNNFSSTSCRVGQVNDILPVLTT